MRILFATGRQYPPQQHGGAQQSAHTLLRQLAKRGHEVEVCASQEPGPRLQVMRVAHRLSGRRLLGMPDRKAGYAVFRAPPWQVSALVVRRCGLRPPDALIVDQPELLVELHDRGLPRRLPVLVRFLDVSFERVMLPPLLLEGTQAFASSRFLAERVHERLGASCPVLYPAIERERVRAAETPRDRVTMINPIEGKGLPIVLEAAGALRDVPFLLVESWPLRDGRRAALRERCRLLPNVKLASWTPDVRTIYSRTRLLLAPSTWEEGFGRVVLEAQVSGIPALVSELGALPEAVGDGGLVLPVNRGGAPWIEAIRSLLGDTERFRSYSHAASQHAQDPRFDPAESARALEALIHAAIQRQA